LQWWLTQEVGGHLSWRRERPGQLPCSPRRPGNSTMETTYNTQVKVLASSNVTVSLGPGNRTNETLLPKPSTGRNSVDMPREKGRLMTPKKIMTVGTWNVRTLYATGAVGMVDT